jgi:hypothetical protein
MCHERGGEGEYPHTHAAFKFKRKLSTTNERYFDYVADDGTVIHPNIKRLDGIVHERHTWEYHRKEGAFLQSEKGPDGDSTMLGRVKRARTLIEAIEEAGM